jgi:L-alanine-DL-glutamate epimerase-like enolase superfamily enzyme
VPKIQSIEFCAAAVPLDRVTSFSNRTVSVRHYGLVRVRADDGLDGIGFCYIGSAGGGIFKAAVEELLAPLLIGQDSHAVEGLWMAMYQEALLQGRYGTVMRALSTLDTALWDLNAKSAGLALHKYLGAVQLESVPAYASGGYYLDGVFSPVLTPFNADLTPSVERFIRHCRWLLEAGRGPGRSSAPTRRPTRCPWRKSASCSTRLLEAGLPPRA